MHALIYCLIALLGGSSTLAVREHKQLAAAHSEAVAAQATVSDLKKAEAAQAAAQAREDAARSAAEADTARRNQIQLTYILATGDELKKPAPAIPVALQLNSLAVSAGDAPTAETALKAQQLADANAAAMAQKIADMEAELASLRADNSAKSAELKAAVADKIAATGQIATLTSTVGVQVDKIATVTAEKTDLFSKLTILTAKWGRLVFWVALAAGLVFCLAHAGVFVHLALRAKHAALTAEHTALATAHSTLQTAHADILKAVNQTNFKP